MHLIEYLPLSKKRISKIVRVTSNLMNRPLFVIVDKVIREIKFPKRPSASTDIMETPATQNRKEVTEIKEKGHINITMVFCYQNCSDLL